MRWYVITLVIILSVVLMYWIASYGDWHLKRNRKNFLPKGNLTRVGEMSYRDEAGLIWQLQPHDRNIFHQPDITPVPPGVPIPYPNLSPSLDYDPDYPNLKFLRALKNGASAEAILQPDGTYLNAGKKMGTYNYSNADGTWGFTMHILLDVIPHFFKSNYEPTGSTAI